MTAPALPRRATNTLVAVAWLKLVVPGVGVASKLPEPTPDMRVNGFIRVPIVGGSPDRDNPMRAPVASAECWLPPAVEGSSKVQTARANVLAETVLAATYDAALMDVVLDLGDYPAVRVRTVQALSEPREVPDDPGSWSRWDVDLLLRWTVQS